MTEFIILDGYSGEETKGTSFQNNYWLLLEIPNQVIFVWLTLLMVDSCQGKVHPKFGFNQAMFLVILPFLHCLTL